MSKDQNELRQEIMALLTPEERRRMDLEETLYGQSFVELVRDAKGKPIRAYLIHPTISEGGVS